MNKGVFRIRELSREALLVDQLKFTNEFEQKAYDIVEKDDIKNIEINEKGKHLELSGLVANKNNATVLINKDHQVMNGTCNCSYYYQNKMYKGPCEHIIALKFKGLKMLK